MFVWLLRIKRVMILLVGFLCGVTSLLQAGVARRPQGRAVNRGVRRAPQGRAARSIPVSPVAVQPSEIAQAIRTVTYEEEVQKLIDIAAGNLEGSLYSDETLRRFKTRGVELLRQVDLSEVGSILQDKNMASFGKIRASKTLMDMFLAAEKSEKKQIEMINLLDQFKQLTQQEQLDLAQEEQALELYDALRKVYDAQVAQLKTMNQQSQTYQDMAAFLKEIYATISESQSFLKSLVSRKQAREVAERRKQEELRALEEQKQTQEQEQQKIAAQLLAKQHQQQKEGEEALPQARVSRKKRLEGQKDALEEMPPKKSMKQESEEEEDEEEEVVLEKAVPEKPKYSAAVEEGLGYLKQVAALFNKCHTDIAPRSSKERMILFDQSKLFQNRSKILTEVQNLLLRAQRSFRGEQDLVEMVKAMYAWLDTATNTKPVENTRLTRSQADMAQKIFDVATDENMDQGIRDTAKELLESLKINLEEGKKQRVVSAAEEEVGFKEIVSEEDFVNLQIMANQKDVPNKISAIVPWIGALNTVVLGIEEVVNQNSGFLTKYERNEISAWKKEIDRISYIGAGSKQLKESTKALFDALTVAGSFADATKDDLREKYAYEAREKLSAALKSLSEASQEIDNAVLKKDKGNEGYLIIKNVLAFYESDLMYWLTFVEKEISQFTESSEPLLYTDIQKMIQNLSKDEKVNQTMFRAARDVARNKAALQDAFTALNDASIKFGTIKDKVVEQKDLWGKAYKNWLDLKDRFKTSDMQNFAQLVAFAIHNYEYGIMSISGTKFDKTKDTEYIFYTIVTRALFKRALEQLTQVKDVPDLFEDAFKRLGKNVITQIDDMLDGVVDSQVLEDFESAEQKANQPRAGSRRSVRFGGSVVIPDIPESTLDDAGFKDDDIQRSLHNFITILQQIVDEKPYKEIEFDTAEHGVDTTARNTIGSTLFGVGSTLFKDMFESIQRGAEKDYSYNDIFLKTVLDFYQKNAVTSKARIVRDHLVFAVVQMYAHFATQKDKVKTFAQELPEILKDWYKSKLTEAQMQKCAQKIEVERTLSDRLTKYNSLAGSYNQYKELESNHKRALESARKVTWSGAGDIRNDYGKTASLPAMLAQIEFIDVSSVSDQDAEVRLISQAAEEILKTAKEILSAGDYNNSTMVTAIKSFTNDFKLASTLPRSPGKGGKPAVNTNMYNDFKGLSDALSMGITCLMDDGGAGDPYNGNANVIWAALVADTVIKTGGTAIVPATAPNNFVTGVELVLEALKEFAANCKDTSMKKIAQFAYDLCTDANIKAVAGTSTNDAKTGAEEQLKIVHALLDNVLTKAEKTDTNIETAKK